MTVKKIIDEDYENVLKVWDKLEMKTMKDYHDMHLKCDFLSFANVFKRFQNNSLRNYGSCLSHYMTAPALSWDSMLNMTKGELELISNNDMYLFIEKGMRNGVFLFLKDTVKPTISV